MQERGTKPAKYNPKTRICRGIENYAAHLVLVDRTVGFRYNEGYGFMILEEE